MSNTEQVTGAFSDLSVALRRINLWGRLALTDMQQTYKRSFMGLAWLAFAFALFVAVKIFIFGSFAPGEPGEFAMWLTVGLWLFFFLQQNVMDGSVVFVNARAWILSTSLPLSGFVLQQIIRGIIKFIYQIPVVLFIVWWSKWPIPVEAFWGLLGFVVILFNAFWVQVVLGILCSRFRDVAHFVQAVMSIMFFVTPILYFPSQVGDRAKFFDYNPLTHYIAIVREPIIYGTVPVKAWIIVSILTVVGWIAALIMLRLFRKRVPFWI